MKLKRGTYKYPGEALELTLAIHSLEQRRTTRSRKSRVPVMFARARARSGSWKASPREPWHDKTGLGLDYMQKGREKSRRHTRHCESEFMSSSKARMRPSGECASDAMGKGRERRPGMMLGSILRVVCMRHASSNIRGDRTPGM